MRFWHTGRDGVCNPVAKVLCKTTGYGKAQNVSDGMRYPVRVQNNIHHTGKP